MSELAGIGFPFRIEAGRLRPARGFAKVQEDVRHLLATRVGERPMLRGYGGGLHQHLQESDDASLRGLIGHDIELALRTYMPGVRLTRPVTVESGAGELRVTVDYVAAPAAAAQRLEISLAVPA